MEDIKLKEDLETAGEPATEEQILAAKKDFVKKVLNSENINVDGCTNEELDNIIGKTVITERINNVIEYALTERLEVADQLHKIIGLKESEASNVYFDYLKEMKIREAENAEKLTAKEKEEILNFREPESDVVIGGNQFKVDKVDHSEDLEDQKGEKLGKYKIEGMN